MRNRPSEAQGAMEQQSSIKSSAAALRRMSASSATCPPTREGEQNLSENDNQALHTTASTPQGGRGGTPVHNQGLHTTASTPQGGRGGAPKGSRAPVPHHRGGGRGPPLGTIPLGGGPLGGPGVGSGTIPLGGDPPTALDHICSRALRGSAPSQWYGPRPHPRATEGSPLPNGMVPRAGPRPAPLWCGTGALEASGAPPRPPCGVEAVVWRRWL